MMIGTTCKLLAALKQPLSRPANSLIERVCQYSTSTPGNDDFRSTPHIPSISVIEEETESSEMQEDVRPPTYSMREEIFAKYPPQTIGDPREVWVESLVSSKKNKDLIRLHPDVFSVKPRLDVLWTNIDWQKRYRLVEHDRQKDRYEMHYGARPWPQKGMGRARHASRTSPIWYQGGKTHPNRGIKGHFFMPPYHLRVSGLIHALSTKLAQDDLRIVQDLEIPTKDPEFIEQLINDRSWGISALMVDVSDIFPENVTAATESIGHVNLMPCYGLNVHSMLKHKTLVLTVDAVKYIEDKLLFALNRFDFFDKEVLSSTIPSRLR